MDTELAVAGIAVLVQKMVDANISGVTFTANPVNGSNDIVIESTWGLGEAIASGIVTPDIFVLSREGNIIEKNIQTKKRGYFLRNNENTLITINGENRQKSSLNKKILKKLLNTGIELEKFFGSAQDIEWAIEYEKKVNKDEPNTPNIYILQSRPVTTLADGSDKDDILWTRAYGDEY